MYQQMQQLQLQQQQQQQNNYRNDILHANIVDPSVLVKDQISPIQNILPQEQYRHQQQQQQPQLNLNDPLTQQEYLNRLLLNNSNIKQQQQQALQILLLQQQQQQQQHQQHQVSQLNELPIDPAIVSAAPSKSIWGDIPPGNNN